MSKRFYLATPCYSDPCPDYVISMLATQKALNEAGHSFHYSYVQGLCYVHQARNWLVRNFMLSDCDEIIFIDSDIGWKAEELVRMASIERNVVGGAAPYRSGEEGFPVLLKRSEGGYPVGVPFEDTKDSGLLEAQVIPTAMMKISRGTFNLLIEKEMAPTRLERDGLTGKEKRRWRSFFDFEVIRDPNGAEDDFMEFGEDVSFCRKCSRAGIPLWIDPRMTLRHWGTHGYAACLDTFLKATTEEELPGVTS